MSASLRNALLDLLGGNPTPQERRSVARLLMQWASEQERLADLEEQDRRKPPSRRFQVRSRTAGRGRKPGNFVRVEREGSGESSRLIIHIGRGLFYQIGSPERMDVRSHQSGLVLVKVEGDAGYKVSVPKGGMPRIRCSSASDLVRLDDGRYAATIRGDSLIIQGEMV